MGTYNMLQPKKYRSYAILRRINDSAYIVALMDNIGFSKTFNVADLSLFDDSNEPLYLKLPNSSSCSSQVEQIDIELIIEDFLGKLDQKKNENQPMKLHKKGQIANAALKGEYLFFKERSHFMEEYFS